jgi:undecaprenyl diphosphate synthase
MSAQTVRMLINRAIGGTENCAVDGSDVGSAECQAAFANAARFASGMDVAKYVFSVVVPVLVGLLIGVWLGKTQSRQQKSLLSIILAWFGSIVSISKFWVKFHVGKSTGSKKSDVYVRQSNGNGTELKKNYVDTPVESGCDPCNVPKHVAVIMDGNRRYGKRMYGKGSMGHFDGGQKALQVIEWLDTEGVKALSLYAFSTENWNRETSEVDTLMGLFLQFVEDDLRPIVFNRKVRVRHICTDESHMPAKLHEAINKLVAETALHATPESLTLNVCLSYGSRGEMLLACQSIARECVAGTLQPDQLTEDSISDRMLTAPCPDPDVLIRTSGEERISNFLLWQLAYTELFFLDKDWPELEKDDFLKVIRTFAQGRQRRFGK